MDDTLTGDTLFAAEGEHAGRTTAQARLKEWDAAWRSMLRGYGEELEARPPVDWANTQKGRKEISLRDCKRFVDGFRLAFGLNLVALVAAALRYKRAYDAHERAAAASGKARGVIGALLDCGRERDEMFAALRDLLTTLEGKA